MTVLYFGLFFNYFLKLDENGLAPSDKKITE